MRESIVQLLLFIAVVSVTVLFVGTIMMGATSLAGSIEGDSERTVAALDADVEFVNDAETDAYDSNASGDEGDVVLYVKNVGGSTLEPTELEVLLDGEYVTTAQRSVIDGDRWRAGTVLEVTIPGDPGAGTHRVLVRIHGTEDRLTFERS